MPANAHAAPNEELLLLEIPVVLPGVENASDDCVARLAERVRAQTGVSRAHAQENAGQAVLCLHYDPNLVPLARLERLAREAGAEISARFRHETMPVRGMHCASCAARVEHVLRRQNGILRASVAFAGEKLKVEYDSELTSREHIAATLKSLGYTTTATTPANASQAHSEHGHDAHSHDHHGHDHDHKADGHDKHEHGPSTELGLSLACGALTLGAFVGHKYLQMPTPAALGIYGAAYVCGGWKLVRHTFPAVLRGRFDVDLLMLLAALGAAILGEWAEGALLLFLFSLGHALEHTALNRARSAIRSLDSIVPRTARVRRTAEHGLAESEIEIPIEELRVGDLAIVRPGERVAVDGQVLAGHSSLDQSAITGESVPIEAAPGVQVFAGAINGGGALEVRVQKLAHDTTMARVIALVEEAQDQKSPTQTFAERFEKIFVPTILIGVVLAAIVPPLAGWLEWKEAILRALSALVAASPCALALATPAAILAGIAQAARNGVLIKGGVHLENLGELDAIALDKTGTLTQGKAEVAAIALAQGVHEDEMLRLAASAEAHSSHPLAQAVVREAARRKLELLPEGELQTLPGRGVRAEVGGKVVLIGNARLFEESGLALPSALGETIGAWSEQGWPSMIVALEVEDGVPQVLGALALADPPRSEARESLEQLRKLGIREIVMLSGDNARVAGKIASEIGVTSVRADLLPGDKAQVVREMQQAVMGQKASQKARKVAMVGDGVNDAPALAVATVGIAMGAGGTDVALETADVALMSGDLSRLAFAVGLSRAARRIVRQNLWIALGMIALLLPSTLLGLAPISLAVVLHEGSTLVVVFNALRLLGYKVR